MSKTGCFTETQSDLVNASTHDAAARNWSTLLADFGNAAANITHVRLVIVSLLDCVHRRACFYAAGSSIEKPQSNSFTTSATQWSPDIAAELTSRFGFDSTATLACIPVGHTKLYSAGLHYQLPESNQTATENALRSLCNLAKTLFEQSSQLIRLQTQFEEAKRESLAEFAAGAGHEINNPIATISGRVQLLLQQETDPARKQALTTIGGQALRIRDMIGDLMLFGRPPTGEPKSVHLAAILAEVIEKRNIHQQCQLTVNLEESMNVWADPYQLAVVLSEILQNSLNAADGNLTISITAELHQAADGTAVRILVRDNGTGLSPQEREHLFDPFYSGRQAGRGLGFGLPKCWRIVKNHGGIIQALPNQDKGLTLEIWWPTEPVAEEPDCKKWQE